MATSAQQATLKRGGRPPRDLMGQQFGRWTVISLSQRRSKGYGGRYWVCRCSCGWERTVRSKSLVEGVSRSCGCLMREVSAACSTKHGFTIDGTGLYPIWCGIVRRTTRPDSHAYSDYGGRGIAIFPEWQSDYPAFRSWILSNLGQRIGKQSLDRIDNDGNYAPGNLRWADAILQAANRRPNIETREVLDKVSAIRERIYSLERLVDDALTGALS